MGRLTKGDIAGYRRSLAMSPSLTRTELERLLDEVEVLIAERERTVATLERLAPSFGEVRAALNELHRSNPTLTRVDPVSKDSCVTPGSLGAPTRVMDDAHPVYG